MTENLQMAELLCTRLCHDLSGPIGAVNNGAEFISEEGFTMQKEAVDLIVSSAFSAVSRLQFYRIAYGSVKTNGEANLADRQRIASDFFIGSKITLDWPEAHTDSSGVSISLRMARLLYNMLIITSNALIRGGNISVRLASESETRKTITVCAKGIGIKWTDDVEKILTGEINSAEMNSKNVQLYLTRYYTNDLNAKFEISFKDDELVLKLAREYEQSQQAV